MSQPTAQQLAQVLHETLGVLRHQGALGLTGLSLPEGALLLRQAGSVAPQASLRVAALQASKSSTAPQSAKVADVEPGDVLDLEARPDLDAVRKSLEGCARCKLSRTRTSIVFGTGDANARLMFIGEGPGRDEDLQGEPFVGEAGRLLDRMIAAMGLSRQSVYIANIVKCRPPKNRDPETDEVMSCEPFLRRQIAAVQPDVVVALGRFAAQTLLTDKTPISRMRGKWRQYGQTRVMPTFHPAYLLRNPGDKKLVWQDLQQVMAQLGPHA